MTERTIDGYAIGLAVEETANGRFYALWPVELPSCIAQGKTTTEAYNRLKAMLPAYKAAQKKRGVNVPEPKKGALAATVAFFTMASTSGLVAEEELWMPIAATG